MTDREGPFKPLNHVAIEDVCDQPHAAVADQRLAVGGYDSRRFLSAMLQGIEPQIYQVGGFRMAINAEDPALLVKFVEIGFFELGRKFSFQQTSHARGSSWATPVRK